MKMKKARIRNQIIEKNMGLIQIFGSNLRALYGIEEGMFEGAVNIVGLIKAI